MSTTQRRRATEELDAVGILHQLTHYQRLPRAALAAASERQAEMRPLFIEEIERYLAAGADRLTQPSPLFFIFHLLGDWREQSAYRPLARLLRCGTEGIEHAIGDAITESAPRVMAAIFDGDPQPLYDLILDQDADQFARSGMLRVLVMLVLDRRLPRRETEQFLRDCATRMKPQAESFIWAEWEDALAHLGMADMRAAVKRLHDDGFIDPKTSDFAWFEKTLRYALDNPEQPVRRNDRLTPFGDTIEELSRWYGFSERYERDRKETRKREWMYDTPMEVARLLPAVNYFKKVGRNDPCPCGSGKKFKKCCLQ